MSQAAAVPAATAGGAIQWVIAPVVALAAFMEIMDISIANVALPHIAGALSSSQNESTWVLTSYLVTNAIIMPISGWLANNFGRKRLFITCIAGFTVTSLLCGLAPNLGTLIVLRALQGATGGGLQPVGQAILTDSFPPEKRGMASAIYGIAAVVAPTVGPTLGGWITDSYEWRWIFLINVPVGVLLILLVQAIIRDPPATQPRPSGRRSVDWLGFSFIALSLGCLQVVLDRGQDADWFGSTLITVLVITSATAFVLLGWRETHHDNPMVDLKLLKSPDFAVTFILMLMLGFMLFGSTFLIPAYAQSLMGYRAIDAGLLLSPGGLVTIALLPLVGRLVNKVDLRILTGIGLVIGAVSLLLMTKLFLASSFQQMMLLRMLQSCALPFLFVPINAMAFRGIPRARVNGASALINLARNFGGGIGIAFASTMLTRRAAFHQSRLVEQLQGLDPSYPDFAHSVGNLLGSAPDSSTTLAQIYATALQQASLLSYLDDFKLLGLVFLALLPLLLLVKPGKGGGGPAPAH
jgi:MFS transporter, DHA2 family, multidrug resistance protein